MAKAENVLCMPGEMAWEIWASEGGASLKLDTRQKGSVPSDFKDVTHFAYPVSRISVAPFWAVSEDPDLLPDIVDMRLETQGLKTESIAGQTTDYQITERDENRSLITSATIAPGKTDAYPKGDADYFDVSANLLPMPRNHVVLWRELGRWAMAVSRNGKAIYYQALSSKQLDPEAILELRCLLLQLYSQGVVKELSGLIVWGDPVDDNTRALLEKELEMQVFSEAKPAPILPEETLALLPEDVALNRESAARSRKMRSRILIALTLFCLALGFFIFQWLWQENKNKELQARIDVLKPRTEWIEPTIARWKAVQPAVDGDLYPLEIIRRVVGLLPEKGVRFTTLEVTPDSVLLRGEASNSGDAIRYRTKLEKDEGLSDFEWDKTKPKIDSKTKIANFLYKAKRKVF
ncbi:MAG: hypothetical protein AAF514_17180 [Verrucomicrobiota bacterium]